MFNVIQPDSDVFDDSVGSIDMVREDFDLYYQKLNSGSRISADRPIKFNVEEDYVSAGYLNIDYQYSICTLVSEKFSNLIAKFFIKDVQLIPAKIIGTDVKHNFFVINFLQSVDCVDVERSDPYRMLPGDESSPLVFTNPAFKAGEMTGLDLGYANLVPRIKLASNAFVSMCRQEKISGIDFWVNNIPS